MFVYTLWVFQSIFFGYGLVKTTIEFENWNLGVHGKSLSYLSKPNGVVTYRNLLCEGLLTIYPLTFPLPLPGMYHGKEPAYLYYWNGGDKWYRTSLSFWNNNCLINSLWPLFNTSSIGTVQYKYYLSSSRTQDNHYTHGLKPFICEDPLSLKYIYYNYVIT